MRLQKLFEYEDLSTEQQNIVSKIAGLKADNEEDAKLLDKIYRILNTGVIGDNVAQAFNVPLEGEPLSDKEKTLVMQDLTKIIADADSDYKSISEMTDQLGKGGVIDIGSLDSPLTSFSNVFTHPTALKVFHDLKNYGTGRKQKGPGEYALACLSNKIRLASGEGDLEIDSHHTIEDVGWALGKGINTALGEKRGIKRYSFTFLPMDECLTRCCLDISGRPWLIWNVFLPSVSIKNIETEIFREFFQSFTQSAGITLHIENLYGNNTHHIVESCFKSLAISMRDAIKIDKQNSENIPSTKGSLSGSH